MSQTYILVKDQEIQGYIDGDPSQVRLGSEYKVISYSGKQSIDSLYYADDRIQEQPFKPSEDHQWSDRDLRWVKPSKETPEEPNFKGFYTEIISSDLYQAILEIGSKNLKKNIAATGFLTSLTAVDNIDTLDKILDNFLGVADKDLGKGELSVLLELLKKYQISSKTVEKYLAKS